MYKNLNCDLLGINGRQSEIIELALTYGFLGIDIDISDLVKRSQRGSFESASRFLTSSKLKVSGFQAPIDLDGDDETFAKEAALLNAVAEVAGRAEAKVAFLDLPNQTDRLPYPEYFDVIRGRVDQVTEIFSKEGVQVGLAFCPTEDGAEAKEFKFVQDAEGFLAFAKSCKDCNLVFDSWTWFSGGGTPELLAQMPVEKVVAVRIADCVEGVAAEAATSEDYLLPGSTNIIDNAAYLKLFADAGLELPVSARGRLAQTGGTRDAFIGKTQDALDQTFKAADLPAETRKPEMFAHTGGYMSRS